MTQDSARRRRWAVTVLAGLVLAAGCVAAGAWQWHRHEQRSATAELVDRNYDAPPVPVEDVLRPGAAPDPDDVWRPVTAVGRYVGDPVLLRNRPVSGTPALHALAPFAVEEGALAGAVLLVDRGWVPSGEDGSGPRSPEVPRDEVELVARVRTQEPPSSRDAPAGQVQAINADDVARALGGDVWPDGAALEAYAVVVTEDGERPAGVGPIPRPSTGVGTNLSYAFQWWVFAVGALVAPVLLIRRERRDLEADGGVDRESPSGHPDGPGARVAPGAVSPRPGRRVRRRPSAEEEEDALLDAQASADR